MFSSIKMLLNERKNGIALKLMDDVEHLWGLENNADFICLKIEALMLLSRQIEALDEMLDCYKDLEESPPTIYSIVQGINIEYAQLSRLIMKDTSVIVREYILPFGDYNAKEFVLTYTALVALHYLGVTIEECAGCNSVIPSSVIIEAEKEAKKIYDHNNRESVMTMGVISNDLIVSETSENDKRIAISVSNSFKTFVSGFESVGNKNDMRIPKLNNKLKFLLGICDYDSIVIAHQRNAVLITGEMVLARFTQLNETKADVAGIADFLCLLRLPAI